MVVYHENKVIIPREHAFDKGELDMIQKNLEAQLAELHDLVEFFESKILQSLVEKNFRLAWSWYDSLSGAYMLAGRLGLAGPEHFDREKAWSERIRTAQFGPSREE